MNVTRVGIALLESATIAAAAAAQGETSAPRRKVGRRGIQRGKENREEEVVLRTCRPSIRAPNLVTVAIGVVSRANAMVYAAHERLIPTVYLIGLLTTERAKKLKKATSLLSLACWRLKLSVLRSNRLRETKTV